MGLESEQGPGVSALQGVDNSLRGSTPSPVSVGRPLARSLPTLVIPCEFLLFGLNFRGASLSVQTTVLWVVRQHLSLVSPLGLLEGSVSNYTPFFKFFNLIIYLFRGSFPSTLCLPCSPFLQSPAGLVSLRRPSKAVQGRPLCSRLPPSSTSSRAVFPWLHEGRSSRVCTAVVPSRRAWSRPAWVPLRSLPPPSPSVSWSVTLPRPAPLP